jgi:hypothetical protein
MGASTSHNFMGLHGLLQKYLYLFFLLDILGVFAVCARLDEGVRYSGVRGGSRTLKLPLDSR